MLKRDITPYQVAEILDQLHKLQTSMDALNSTINFREIDLVNSATMLSGTWINYAYQMKNVVINFVGDGNLTDFLLAIQRLNNILDDFKHKLTLTNVFVSAIVFFAIGVIFFLIASIVAFEYRRWRKRLRIISAPLINGV